MTGPGVWLLLNLFVRKMLAAERTELLQLDPLRRGLLVLGARIILPLALGALKCNVLARHNVFCLPAHNSVCALIPSSQNASAPQGGLAAPQGALFDNFRDG